MEHPIRVALARAVPTLPVGTGWMYEPKFDGHRVILIRDAETVRLQGRSGQMVTTAWMDLAGAGMHLAPGVTLDGEAVIWRNGKLDFGAVQSRAAAGIARARELAHILPASYAAFDILTHPAHGDIRGRPYLERRALLLQVLEHVGPPLQPVPATDDIEVARLWYSALQEQNIEGIVAKPATSAYRSQARDWLKIRHADTVDCDVIGYTGSPRHPRALAVLLPDGRRVLSQRLPAALAAQAAERLRDAGPGRRARTDDGVPYLTAPRGIVIEALAGTTRHAVVAVTRFR
ncbi:ATP-dependent DNA ligase [Streptomyces sp. NPDC017940]|uniref:ATP-dependent DNA ligase n=1 Tax=Streptomyces sp. NPDC017940 TaxID=3365017 RepID=UPI0037BCEA43